MVGNATGVSSSGSEPEIEARPAGGAVAYRYAGSMGPDDFHNDRQTQSGSVGTPEALEDVWPILRRDAGPAVLDADRPLGSDIDDHFGPRCRMREGILNEIAQCIGNRGSVAGDHDRMIGAGQRDRPAG